MHAQLLSSQRVNTLQRLLQKIAITTKPAQLLKPSFFLESRPLWQKIVMGLIVSLPFLISGLVLNLTVLISIGLCSLICSAGFISLFEYYKKQHEALSKSDQEQANALSTDLSDITNEISSFAKELGHYQTLLKTDLKCNERKIVMLERDKKHLESSVSDLSKRNTVLCEIKESLLGENKALHSVIAEKLRLLLVQNQTLIESQQGLANALMDKTKLQLEIEKYENFTVNLTKELNVLTLKNKQQEIEQVYFEMRKKQLKTEFASLLRQRRYLVTQLKIKNIEIEKLTFTWKDLSRALAESYTKQEQLITAQELLKEELKSLNIKLFESQIVQSENQQLLKNLLNSVMKLQEDHNLLHSQLAALMGENNISYKTVAEDAARVNRYLMELSKELELCILKQQSLLQAEEINIQRKAAMIDGFFYHSLKEESPSAILSDHALLKAV